MYTSPKLRATLYIKLMSLPSLSKLLGFSLVTPPPPLSQEVVQEFRAMRKGLSMELLKNTWL